MTNATTQATIKHGELNLRKVTGRKAIAGDYVVFKRSHNGTPAGKPFKVESGGQTYQSETHGFTIGGWGGHEQYDLYEVAKTPKLLVGATVVTLTHGEFYEIAAGTKGVVLSTDSGGDSDPYSVKVEAGDDYIDFFREEDLKLVPTFKVGDKVRVHAAANGRYGDLFDGAEGVIDDIDTEGYYEEPYKVHSEAADDYDRFKAVDLDLITELVLTPIQLKKGDHVKILTLSKYGMDYVGMTGFVDAVDFMGMGYTTVAPPGSDQFGLYLPEQLELIEPKTEEDVQMKTFEVGDTVKVLNADNGRFGDQVDGAIGKVEVIRDHDDEGRTYKVRIGVDFDRYAAKDLELVVASPPRALKEGDKVRMISYNPSRGFGAVKTGDEGVITDIDFGGEITLDFEEQKGWYGVASELELVSAAPVTYEMGDWVRILDKSKIAANEDIVNGGVYEVIEEGDYIVIRDAGREGKNRLSITPREQAFIEKTDAPTKTTKIVGTDSSHNFAVGDIIRVLDTSKITGHFDGAADLTNGETYEVLEVDCDGDIEVRDDDNDLLYILRSEFEGIELVDSAPVEAPAALKVGDFITIDFDFVGGNFNYIDITRGKAYEVVEHYGCCGGLAFNDDIDDVRIAHIKQGAYTVVDVPVKMEAPAPALTSGGLTVGDTVTVVNSPGFNLFRYEVGETAKVTGFRDDGYVYIENEEGKREHMEPGQVVKFGRAESAAKYKVGDRVAFTAETNYGSYNLPEGSRTGTVIEMTTHTTRPVYLVNIDNYPYSLNFTEDELMAGATRELQVGDIVRLDRKESEAYGSMNKPGDIGEVTDIQHGTSTQVTVPGRVPYSNYEMTTLLTLLVANENREDKK